MHSIGRNNLNIGIRFVCGIKRRDSLMKYALEYKGYYLDTVMKDGIIYGNIRGLNINIKSLTVQGLVNIFREKDNNIY